MLAVENLSIQIDGQEIVRALSFAVAEGETLGIVGESGSGKSMTALAIMGLLPPAMRMGGVIRLQDQNLVGLDEAALCALRGRRMAMVFQEPMSALNPVMRIGDQIAEGLVLHGLMDKGTAIREAIRLIERVGLPQPSARARAFPHQLSGGQRQRAMIAMAIACRPGLLIADEPTSALDVTVQAEILALLREIRDETGMAMLLITHDLAVISRSADRVLVLYGGAGMETGATRTLLEAPRHPYTRGLLAAIPRGNAHSTRLRPIGGHVPDPSMMPRGCPFYGRCAAGDSLCRDTRPDEQPGPTRARCHHLPEAS
jgi:peptide/nickel transport system ATP-binding protein